MSVNQANSDYNYKITSGRNRKRFCLVKHLTNHYLPYEDYGTLNTIRLTIPNSKKAKKLPKYGIFRVILWSLFCRSLVSLGHFRSKNINFQNLTPGPRVVHWRGRDSPIV